MTPNADLYLAPAPKRLTRRRGIFDAAGKRFIKLEADGAQALVPAALKVGIGWEITASPKVTRDQTGLMIRMDKEANIPTDGYRLSIRPDGMEIVASTPAGAFYGACTLAQIIGSHGMGNSMALVSPDTQHPTPDTLHPSAPRPIPCLSIADWPDFPARGVMLDISRDKVPTIETLYRLVDLLAGWKINQLQLYTEHTFAYHAHPTVWENASPMTGQEILALDAYCRSRFVELVPNQNSFGHMERWLKHDKYRPMAEAPNGCDTAWGFRPPFSLCPIDRRSIPFIRDLYDELLPHFSSRLFNVGCDETIDLGCGRSRKACEERGKGRVYLDFLLDIHSLVKERGRRMMFWGDIILGHPELIAELPKDVIALEWGYEADHPFAENCARFAEAGIPFYVCPGTSTWITFAGRTENAIGNITNAAMNGLRYGAAGLLNTDWGDCGHWQPLSVSYLGFMAGAMASWNAKADLRKGLAEALSEHAFGDSTRRMGRAYYDLGNVYLAFKTRIRNASVPGRLLLATGSKLPAEDISISEFEEMEHRLSEIADIAREESMTCPDAGIVREEFEQTLRVLHLAADVGKWRLGGEKPKDLQASIEQVKKSHERVWLMRNRPGGLEDSLKRLDPVRAMDPDA